MIILETIIPVFVLIFLGFILKRTGLLKDEYFELLRGIKPVTSDLSNYITDKALTGLFTKVSEKEYDIRHNAGARVNDVLKSVFGQLDK